MNLACITLPKSLIKQVPPKSMLRAINDNLPTGMVMWHVQEVPLNTRSRKANYRHYLYRLEAVDDWPYFPEKNLIEEACSAIQGRHDFTNLCKIEGDINPIRIIDECSPWVDSSGKIIGISVKARAFLWNQVRRIASAVSGVVSGRITLDDLISALENPDVSVDLGRANSDGLILWSISHDEIDGKVNSIIPEINFTKRPEDTREYVRWLSLMRHEMAAFLEREWLIRLKLE